jgi:hypothetical protein
LSGRNRKIIGVPQIPAVAPAVVQSTLSFTVRVQKRPSPEPHREEAKKVKVEELEDEDFGSETGLDEVILDDGLGTEVRRLERELAETKVQLADEKTLRQIAEFNLSLAVIKETEASKRAEYFRSRYQKFKDQCKTMAGW